MASIDDGRDSMRTHGRMADLIVKGAIALVTAACFIGAYLQLQVGFWPAVIGSLTVYISLLLVHALTRRGERVEALATEVDRLEGELARAHVAGPAAIGYGKQPARQAPPPPPRADTRTAPRAQPRQELKAPTMPPPERAPQMPPPVLRAEPALGSPLPPASRAPQRSAPAADPTFAGLIPEAAPQSGPGEPTLSPWPDPSAPADTSVHDYWSFRPAKPDAPEKKPSPAEAPFEPRKGNKAASPVPAESDDDLEALQGMIKRLAEEANVGNGPEGAQAAQEAATRVSVDALNTTAGTMRAAASKAPAASGRKAKGAPAATGMPSAPPPIAPVHSQLASVGAALAVQRVKAQLDPIVGLADQQVHHYEMTVAPIDERGGALLAGDVERALAGSGLLPLLDSARLTRAAQVARSFASEGRAHQVFVGVAAESLANDRYLDDLANIYRQNADVAGQLVLTFSQADVAQFGGPEWSALTDMRDLGFQFALIGVSDLDSEFTALRAAGFTFVKIDSARLNTGLRAAGHTMAGGEVCQYLDELGLSVIVDRIDSEPARTKVVESGVRMGQGPLFGAPLTVPAEPSSGFGTAAA